MSIYSLKYGDDIESLALTGSLSDSIRICPATINIFLTHLYAHSRLSAAFTMTGSGFWFLTQIPYLPFFGSDRRLTLEGLSPRVRRNHHIEIRLRGSNGTISACAEEPSSSTLGIALPWDYLRVCGGTLPSPFDVCFTVGLSPRVRRNPGVIDLYGSIPLRSVSANRSNRSLLSYSDSGLSVHISTRER